MTENSAGMGPVERGVRPLAWTPSEAQLGVLKLAQRGLGLYTYCRTRAEHGARTCTIRSLRKRGLIEGHDKYLTDAGRALMAALGA
jgi:hypothetical protein